MTDITQTRTSPCSRILHFVLLQCVCCFNILSECRLEWSVEAKLPASVSTFFGDGILKRILVHGLALVRPVSTWTFTITYLLILDGGPISPMPPLHIISNAPGVDSAKGETQVGLGFTDGPEDHPLTQLLTNLYCIPTVNPTAPSSVVCMGVTFFLTIAKFRSPSRLSLFFSVKGT